MRLRNIPGSREVIAQSPLAFETPAQAKGKWKELLGYKGPLYIEIGMGKGRFIMDCATQNPDIFYIGIEKYSSVLLRAIQKMEESPLPNIRFIRMDAEEIESVFAPGEVSRIYLNFSDPWPKDRHAKRRLPSGTFLKRYNNILIPGGLVEFKTDNRDLFDFAVEEAANSSFETTLISYDLHSDAKLMENNIMTEYEEKFSSKGNPIYKLVCKKPD